MTSSDRRSDLTDEQSAAEVSPLVHIVAPIVAIGATMLVRKWMNSGYRRVASGPVPTAGDPAVTFTRALMWSAITAATAAVVEVAVYRIANHLGERQAAR